MNIESLAHQIDAVVRTLPNFNGGACVMRSAMLVRMLEEEGIEGEVIAGLCRVDKKEGDEWYTWLTFSNPDTGEAVYEGAWFHAVVRVDDVLLDVSMVEYTGSSVMTTVSGAAEWAQGYYFQEDAEITQMVRGSLEEFSWMIDIAMELV